jgi:hypothetical protein
MKRNAPRGLREKANLPMRITMAECIHDSVIRQENTARAELMEGMGKCKGKVHFNITIDFP